MIDYDDYFGGLIREEYEKKQKNILSLQIIFANVIATTEGGDTHSSN